MCIHKIRGNAALRYYMGFQSTVSRGSAAILSSRPIMTRGHRYNGGKYRTVKQISRFLITGKTHAVHRPSCVASLTKLYLNAFNTHFKRCLQERGGAFKMRSYDTTGAPATVPGRTALPASPGARKPRTDLPNTPF